MLFLNLAQNGVLTFVPFPHVPAGAGPRCAAVEQTYFAIFFLFFLYLSLFTSFEKSLELQKPLSGPDWINSGIRWIKWNIKKTKKKNKTVGIGEFPGNNVQPSCFCIFNTLPEMSGAFVLTLSMLVATVKPKIEKKKKKSLI